MIIEYDGIGSTPDKKQFTEDEFLRLMNDTFTHKNWKEVVPDLLKCVQLSYKDGWVLPDDFIFFTVHDWIEYSGARVGGD